MKEQKALLGLLILLTVFGLSSGALITLTEDTFEEYVTNEDAWLVLFHKGGKIKEYAKLIQDIATQVNDDVGPIKLGSIDCGKHSDPCLDFGVKKRYPYLGLMYYDAVKAGHQIAEGATVDDEVKWLYQVIDGKVTRIGDHNYDSLVGEQGARWMLVFTQELSDCWLCRTYHSVASDLAEKAHRLFKVGRVICSATSDLNKDICTRFGLFHNESVIFPTVRFVDDGKVHTYSGYMPNADEPLIDWVHRLDAEKAAPQQEQVEDKEGAAAASSEVKGENGEEGQEGREGSQLKEEL